MKANLVSTLKALGFSALTPSLFWCRAGDLIHVVQNRKNRYGERDLSALVWSSSLLGEGEEFAPTAIQSPVCASVSPRGMVSSWSWKKEDIDPEFVASMLKAFFRQFATLGDIRAAIGNDYVTPFFADRLEHGQSRPDVDVRVASRATYELLGGARSRKHANDLAYDFLIDVLANTGYSMVQGEDVVAIRPRDGNMLDCVRLVVDQFGTFGAFVCFPWSTKVWSVDRRWKGSYYPMLYRYVGGEDHPILVDLSEKQNADRERLRELVEECSAEFSEIRDVHSFAAHLDSQWSNVAGGLLRLPLD